ncbi:MAG: hypothetical protein ABI353_04535 [Isosphaeraceae bacterium]
MKKTTGPKHRLKDSTPHDLDQPQWTDPRASAQATRAAHARQVSGRRRFVDPTTCERDYSAAEIEFMQAMQDYKAQSGRMFPTWSEVLEVLHSLGYEKIPPGAEASPTGVHLAPHTVPFDAAQSLVPTG